MSYLLGVDFMKGDNGGKTSILVVLNRHHWCARDVRYNLLTMSYLGFIKNHDCVVDDFGNLVIVNER